MVTWLTHNLLWTEGFSLVIILVIVGIVSYWWYPLRYVLLIGSIFCLYFFRNPERICPEAVHDAHVLICPADGKIVAIEHDEQNGIEGYAHKVSIFLSPFDVHVQWLPTSGAITGVSYRPGAFVPAFLPKSSDLNERNDLLLTTSFGKSILVRQIAGTIARKIICWVKPGEEGKAGMKYGMIKFGSRVDILLPKEVTISVAVDQRVYGGQTVLGRWHNVNE